MVLWIWLCSVCVVLGSVQFANDDDEFLNYWDFASFVEWLCTKCWTKFYGHFIGMKMEVSETMMTIQISWKQTSTQHYCVCFFSCIYNPFSESIHFIANIEREKGVSRDKRERGTWKPSVVVMPSTRQVLMIKMLRAIWPFIQLQTVFPLPPKIWGYSVCGFHEPNSNRFEYMLQQHQPIWILWMIECNRTAVQ